jgi:hypothetical protein
VPFAGPSSNSMGCKVRLEGNEIRYSSLQYRDKSVVDFRLGSGLSSKRTAALPVRELPTLRQFVTFPLILLRLYAVRFHSPRLKPGIRVFIQVPHVRTSGIMCGHKLGCVNLRVALSRKRIGFQKCRSCSSAGRDGRGYAMPHKARRSRWLIVVA